MAKKLSSFLFLSNPVRKPQRYFSAEKANHIAKKSGFSPDYPLANKLNDAAGFYDDFKEAVASPSLVGTEGKDFLRKWKDVLLHWLNASISLDGQRLNL